MKLFETTEQKEMRCTCGAFQMLVSLVETSTNGGTTKNLVVVRCNACGKAVRRFSF
jgi:hypothetical protein